MLSNERRIRGLRIRGWEESDSLRRKSAVYRRNWMVANLLMDKKTYIHAAVHFALTHWKKASKSNIE